MATTADVDAAAACTLQATHRLASTGPAYQQLQVASGPRAGRINERNEEAVLVRGHLNRSEYRAFVGRLDVKHEQKDKEQRGQGANAAERGVHLLGVVCARVGQKSRGQLHGGCMGGAAAGAARRSGKRAAIGVGQICGIIRSDA